MTQQSFSGPSGSQRRVPDEIGLPGLRSGFNVSDWLCSQKKTNYWSSISGSPASTVSFPALHDTWQSIVPLTSSSPYRPGWLISYSRRDEHLQNAFSTSKLLVGLWRSLEWCLLLHLTFDCKSYCNKTCTPDGWPPLLSYLYHLTDDTHPSHQSVLPCPCFGFLRCLKFTASNLNLQSFSPHETFWHLHPHYHDTRVQHNSIQLEPNIDSVQIQ